MMPELRKITFFTIGHSNRSVEEFIGLLKEHDIKVLVDVRAFPTSKIKHFKKEEMEKWIPQYGIEYVWLGKELGGFRTGGYKKYMETAEFQRGISKLISIGMNKRTCICCMEKEPKYCHRNYISSALLKLGNEVIHIIGPGKVYHTKLLE